MKLPRSFESRLRQVVEAALDNPEDVGPILLQGQTASGKSLALVWLAHVLAKSGRAAVLHQSRRRDRPSATEIEAYGLWAEGAAGLKTVLIWDGMVVRTTTSPCTANCAHADERVLIVGSTYLNAEGAKQAVTAPIHLDGEEAESVGTWLGSYGIEMPPASGGADTSFLALLYRALPETEAGLRRGLALEMRAAESGMESLSRDRKQHEPETRMTAIAEALMAAGLDIETLAPATHAPEDLPELALSERSTTEQLSAMLLVAGRRGLSVPLELALRLVGREGWSCDCRLSSTLRHIPLDRGSER